MHQHTLTSAQARDYLAGADMGDPIGFRTVREQLTTEPCDRGCLAMGSSPHFHTRIAAYELIGTGGILTIDATTHVGIRASTIHPFGALDPVVSTPVEADSHEVTFHNWTDSNGTPGGSRSCPQCRGNLRNAESYVGDGRAIRLTCGHEVRNPLHPAFNR